MTRFFYTVLLYVMLPKFNICNWCHRTFFGEPDCQVCCELEAWLYCKATGIDP